MRMFAVMARRKGMDGGEEDVEPDLVEILGWPLGQELTPGHAGLRVAQDASAELGGIEPVDPATDQAPDITPDQLESRSPPSQMEEAKETARPDHPTIFVHHEEGE